MAGRVRAGHGVAFLFGCAVLAVGGTAAGFQVTAGLLLGARGVVRPRRSSGSWQGSRWQARSWAAMLGILRRGRAPMTALRTAAMARCARPVRLESSPKTTSRTFSGGPQRYQWDVFADRPGRRMINTR